MPVYIREAMTYPTAGDRRSLAVLQTYLAQPHIYNLTVEHPELNPDVALTVSETGSLVLMATLKKQEEKLVAVHVTPVNFGAVALFHPLIPGEVGQPISIFQSIPPHRQPEEYKGIPKGAIVLRVND